MASVSDTRYRQRAVIEFLVAEKEKNVGHYFLSNLNINRTPTEQISLKLRTFMQIWRENPNVVNKGKHIMALYMKT
jgi:hypothetical protein